MTTCTTVLTWTALAAAVPCWGWVEGGTGPPNCGYAAPPQLSRTLDRLWLVDAQKKMSKFDAARCQNLRLKCTKFDFRWVAPIAAFKGTYFWASEGEGKEGTEREEVSRLNTHFSRGLRKSGRFGRRRYRAATHFVRVNFLVVAVRDSSVTRVVCS